MRWLIEWCVSGAEPNDAFASASAVAAAGSRCLLLQLALAQEREEARLRHRSGKKEALAHVAAHAVDRLQVGGVFDAFGDRRSRRNGAPD